MNDPSRPNVVIGGGRVADTSRPDLGTGLPVPCGAVGFLNLLPDVDL
jgi:hypothetical protein